MSTDLLLLIQWWFLFLLFSLIMLPVTTVIFKPFFDKGYIFSKTLGVIAVSYSALLIGTLRLIPFSFFSLTCFMLILGLLNYGGVYFFQKKQTSKTILSFLKSNWNIIIFEEILFFGALYLLALIRSFSPDIHGLEKYMDYGFMNSILRSEFFPPKDMWLTPFSINYYYFGHFTGAVLTKLSTIPSYLTYNLILASVFSLSFVSSFSIGANLFRFLRSSRKLLTLKTVVSGMLTAVLVTVSGNLHTLYAFFKPYENEKPVPIWELPFMPLTFPNSYWYPNATRFIFNTIHEFPMYSWVVADLHGHVFDIPFVLTTLAVLLSFLQRQTERKKEQKQPQETRENVLFKLYHHHPFPLGYIVLLGFLLSVMYMTNAWDGLIYMLLSGIFLLYIHIILFKDTKSLAFLLNKDFFLPLLFSGSLLFISFSVFSLPFSLNFKPFVSGIGVLCSPEFLVNMESFGPFLFEAEHCQRSPWWQLLMLYGFFYFFIFAFLAFLTRVKSVKVSDTYVLLLIILGTLLILIPEFIYVKDIYPAHYRANTMFKLVFQSFILLSVTSSYVLIRILTAIHSGKLPLREKIFSVFFVLISLILLTVVLLYPFQAVNSYYGNLKNYSGLDGIKYLDMLYPSDYLAIHWLNDHVSGQPVILEAQGDSYTDFARVSANTGLPTVLGWTVHEWLWRNDYDIPNPPADPDIIYEVPAPRISEIQMLYETEDLKETQRLLKKYDISYVFLGVLEKQKYPLLNEQKWEKIGKVVYKNGPTVIYKIN